MSLTDPYIKQWNVMEEYQTGDIVINGEKLFVVQNRGLFEEVMASQDEINLNNVRHTVDEYHKDKNLPTYDEIMKVFYEARPEYQL